MRFLLVIALLLCSVWQTNAAELTIAGVTGDGQIKRNWESLFDAFEGETGNTVKVLSRSDAGHDIHEDYEGWLAQSSSDVDLYVVDIVRVPQMAHHFIDLGPAATGVVAEHFPEFIEAYTVDGHLMGLPLFGDAPALFFRKDLLEKYNKPVPVTWNEMEATASYIMERERYAGNDALWGYVWQGRRGEGLTCNLLEWTASHGGGRLIELDGRISINNSMAIAALERAASWVGTISPKDVLDFDEERSRVMWNAGNAVFMRNWPYAHALSSEASSPVKGKFGIVPMPAGEAAGAVSAATLGGWGIAVSRYSKNPETATALALFLTSPSAQKMRVTTQAALPTITALYDDPDVNAAMPVIRRWKMVLDKAIARPVGVATVKYGDISMIVQGAVRDVLEARSSAALAVKNIEGRLKELKGASWLDGTPFLLYAELLEGQADASAPKRR